MAALVRALANQKAITGASRDVLLDDLRVSLTASTHAAGLAHFAQDSATPGGPAGALLAAAGKSLTY